MSLDISVHKSLSRSDNHSASQWSATKARSRSRDTKLRPSSSRGKKWSEARGRISLSQIISPSDVSKTEWSYAHGKKASSHSSRYTLHLIVCAEKRGNLSDKLSRKKNLSQNSEFFKRQRKQIERVVGFL